MMPSSNQPARDDVVVMIDTTTIPESYVIAVVPHPAQLRYPRLDVATDVARRWALVNNVAAWQTGDGLTFRAISVVTDLHESG